MESPYKFSHMNPRFVSNFVAAADCDCGIRVEIACLHDNVRVFPLVQFISSECVPVSQCAIRRSGETSRRVWADGGVPHSTLVPLESADPISCFCIPQHRLG